MSVATSADRLYEIALEELSQQRATVERACAAVAPVSAVAIAIAAALAKPAFEASGLWQNRCAVGGVVGAAFVLLCGAILFLEPLGKLELVLRADALSNNQTVQLAFDDADAFQIALARWIGEILIEKNKGGMRRVRITLAVMLLALGIEAAGLALAAVLPAPHRPPCGGSRHGCARAPSGLALTAVRLSADGVLQLWGHLDARLKGALRASTVFNHGVSGRRILTVPVAAGKFVVSMRPIGSRRPVCSARYSIVYPGSSTVAGTTVAGSVAVPYRAACWPHKRSARG